MERPQDADVVVEGQHDQVSRRGDDRAQPQRFQTQRHARVHQVHLESLGQETVQGEAQAQQERRVQVRTGQAQADVQRRGQRSPYPHDGQQQYHVEYDRTHAQQYEDRRERHVQQVRVIRVHGVVFPRVVRHRTRVVALIGVNHVICLHDDLPTI